MFSFILFKKHSDMHSRLSIWEFQKFTLQSKSESNFSFIISSLAAKYLNTNTVHLVLKEHTSIMCQFHNFKWACQQIDVKK